MRAMRRPLLRRPWRRDGGASEPGRRAGQSGGVVYAAIGDRLAPSGAPRAKASGDTDDAVSSSSWWVGSDPAGAAPAASAPPSPPSAKERSFPDPPCPGCIGNDVVLNERESRVHSVLTCGDRHEQTGRIGWQGLAQQDLGLPAARPDHAWAQWVGERWGPEDDGLTIQHGHVVLACVVAMRGVE